MRKPILFALLFAAVLLASVRGGTPAEAQASLIPCFGAPADYVAANDLVDGVADGKVSYPEARVFLEAQGHVRAAGETSRHHMEHIHIGMCFPYAETWKQPMNGRTLDVRYVFHHVKNYTITQGAGNFVSKPGSGRGYRLTAAQIATLQAAMDASADSTQTVFMSHLSTGTFLQKCRMTFKASLAVVATNSSAVVQNWEPELQATTYIDYGEATPTACVPEYTRDQFRARDWVPLPNMGYMYSTIFAKPASQLADPVPEPWSQVMAGGGFVGSLYVDPNFHEHRADGSDNTGIWTVSKGQIGTDDFTETIPTDTFPSGLHRLVFLGDRIYPSFGGIGHSSLAVLPFTVATTCT
jgi:hypothetical protein